MFEFQETQDVLFDKVIEISVSIRRAIKEDLHKFLTYTAAKWLQCTIILSIMADDAHVNSEKPTILKW